MRRWLTVILLVCWGVIYFSSSLVAQSPPEPLLLERSATPSQLQVGQETEIQVVVQVQDMAACVQTQSQPAEVVLVIDISTSMDNNNKMAAARDAASQFIEAMDLTRDRVAVVAFNTSASNKSPLTQDKTVARQAVEALQTVGQTDIAVALREADVALNTRRAEATANVILLSDGGSDEASALAAAQLLKNKGFEIFTISLGNSSGQALMRDLASSSGGYWIAPSASELAQIYTEIQQRIETGGLQDVEVTVTYDDAYLDLLTQSVTPPATIDGPALAWQLPQLSDGSHILSFRLRAVGSGSLSASPSAQLRYLCGEESRVLNLGADADLIILPPSTPTPLPYCELDPLSNDCISTVAFLGPLSLPCSGLGLPWWVCLVLLLLLLGAFLLWLLWQQLENQRRQTTPVTQGPITPPDAGASTWPPLPPPPVPELLQPLARVRHVQPPLKTIVVGLGGTGHGVIQTLEKTLQEAYGEIPSTVRYLNLDIENRSDAGNMHQVPVNQSVAKLMERAVAPDTDIAQIRAWLPADMQLDTRTHATGRPLRRLALFADLSAVKARLSKELTTLLREPGEDVTIYVVAALSGMTGNSLLVDVAHWLRLQAQAANVPGVSIHALLLLPETHTAGVPFENQGPLWQTAAAAWRELNRFQLVFDPPYPMPYLNRRTSRPGKLFERVYLLGPERNEGPSLTATPLENGLYPAVADIIVGLADPTTRPAWEESARAVDSRLNTLQRQRLEPLYASLGSFTYILPIEDLLQRHALRFMQDWIDALRTSSVDARESALTFITQPMSARGISSTALIRSVAELSRMDYTVAVAQAETRGLKLMEWLSPFTEDGTQKLSRESVSELATSDMRHGVLTSDILRAPDYAADTQRVLKQADAIVAQLDHVRVWLEGGHKVQCLILKRLLDEQLETLLAFDPEYPDNTGPAAALTFLQGVQALLTRYHEVVQQAQAQYVNEARSARDLAQEQRDALVALARDVRDQHPTYRRAVLSGIVPAVGATLAVGALTLAVPTLSLPLGVLSLVAGGVGLWFSQRVLFRKSALVQRQHAYLDAEQARLEAEVTLALYKAWDHIVEDWRALVEQTMQPVACWDESLATLLATRLPEIHEVVAARRARRDAIQVRKYLDDEALETALYQRFFDPDVLTEARARVCWQLTSTGMWQPYVTGTEAIALEPVQTDIVEQALLNVARAYASRVRMLDIASVMTEWYAATTVAKDAGPGSAPLIRMHPDLQPESEAHRLMSVQTQQQPAYFNDILSQLRKPVAQTHSEQLSTSSHAHRCAVLASLNILRLPGLPTWEQAVETYEHTSHVERPALHIFPAEGNAARWETRLPNISYPVVLLGPTTCLALENPYRALAFWRALACGWIKEREVAQRGITSLWAFVLDLPDAESLSLTKADAQSPSLWRAAVDFVLADASDQVVEMIEAAWEHFVNPANVQQRRAAVKVLESALSRVDEMQAVADPREAELHILLRLVAEDGLRRLEGGNDLFK